MALWQALQVLKNSWLESLTFFLPSRLVPFVLVSLKALKDLYKSLGRAFTFIPFFIIAYISLYGKPTTTFGHLLEYLAFSGVIIGLLSGTRPSMDYKTTTYFNAQYLLVLKLFGGMLLLFYIPSSLLVNHSLDASVLIFALGTLALPFKTSKRLTVYNFIVDGILFLGVLNSLFFHHMFVYARNKPAELCLTFFNKLLFLVTGSFFFYYSSLGALLPLLIFTLFLSPLVIFTALFMLDSQKTFKDYSKAPLRALLMLVYNYPFCFILYQMLMLLFAAVSLGVQVFFPRAYLLSVSIQTLFFLVIVPFYCCVLTNFYVKRLHDQFSLYYKR